MNFDDKALQTFIIEDQRKPANAVEDIKKIIETYYDLGKVDDVHIITVGDTNYNYYITLDKDGIKTKYFAQLFYAGKTLAEVKRDLTLRKYFMENTKSQLKCAVHYETKDGGYAVICESPQTSVPRYFCMFQFMPGNAIDRDVWAFGRMSDEMLNGIATGIANYHIGAYGFAPPAECVGQMMDFTEELADYKKVLTEEFEKRRENVRTDPYYQDYEKYQPRLLELLDRYTANYLAAKDQLTECVCHMDPSANNYLFDDKLQAISICDLDWSQQHVRLFDISWIILEAFCDYDPDEVTTNMDLDRCVALVDAYDAAIEMAGNPKPGKLSRKEREMLPEIFQLVSMRFGYYNPWLLIMQDNPSSSPEYNLYWGNWGKTAIEFVEEHMEEFKAKLLKEKTGSNT